jgi:hypothetical protein
MSDTSKQRVCTKAQRCRYSSPSRRGEAAKGGPDSPFSPDWFLYVRSCVVANGRSTFEQVLADPREMLKDLEFEALLCVASKAYERKTGKEFTYVPSTSYETFSNDAGWKA